MMDYYSHVSCVMQHHSTGAHTHNNFVIFNILVSFIFVLRFLFFHKIDTWTDRPFKGFTANAKQARGSQHADPGVGRALPCLLRCLCRLEGRDGGCLRFKRGLEYGVQAPVFYGNLREQTGENGFPRIPAGSLCCSYRNLRKSPETSGSLRENVI